MSLKKFFFIFSFYTLSLSFFCWLLQDIFSFSHFFIPKFWVIFWVMAGITLIVYLVSWFVIKSGGDHQVFTVLGTIVIRLLISMIIVLFYLNQFRVEPVLFVVNFFSVYFLFTTFEIYCLLLNLRHQIRK